MRTNTVCVLVLAGFHQRWHPHLKSMTKPQPSLTLAYTDYCHRCLTLPASPRWTPLQLVETAAATLLGSPWRVPIHHNMLHLNCLVSTCTTNVATHDLQATARVTCVHNLCIATRNLCVAHKPCQCHPQVCRRHLGKFQGLATCRPHRGNTAIFWSDHWMGDTLKDTYPQLFSFTTKPKCSIRYFMDQETNRKFILPLSTQAAVQFEELQSLLLERVWDDNTNDSWSYSWGPWSFSSRKAYKVLIGHTEASPLFPWLWSSSNLGKHKFFFWLLLRDRLNTRNHLRRKNMELEDYNYVLYSSCEETLLHLFFECPFSQDCWNSILISWNLNLPPSEIFITACWIIWTTRNKIIFDQGQVNLNGWKREFKEEFGLVCTKTKASRQPSLSSWRDSYNV
jgi:hypothetical protein